MGSHTCGEIAFRAPKLHLLPVNCSFASGWFVKVEPTIGAGTLGWWFWDFMGILLLVFMCLRTTAPLWGGLLLWMCLIDCWLSQHMVGFLGVQYWLELLYTTFCYTLTMVNGGLSLILFNGPPPQCSGLYIGELMCIVIFSFGVTTISLFWSWACRTTGRGHNIPTPRSSIHVITIDRPIGI